MLHGTMTPDRARAVLDEAIARDPNSRLADDLTALKRSLFPTTEGLVLAPVIDRETGFQTTGLVEGTVVSPEVIVLDVGRPR